MAEEESDEDFVERPLGPRSRYIDDEAEDFWRVKKNELQFFFQGTFCLLLLLAGDTTKEAVRATAPCLSGHLVENLFIAENLRTNKFSTK